MGKNPNELPYGFSLVSQVLRKRHSVYNMRDKYQIKDTVFFFKIDLPIIYFLMLFLV